LPSVFLGPLITVNIMGIEGEQICSVRWHKDDMVWSESYTGSAALAQAKTFYDNLGTKSAKKLLMLSGSSWILIEVYGIPAVLAKIPQ